MTRGLGLLAVATVTNVLLLGGDARAAGAGWAAEQLPPPTLDRGDRFGATLAIGKNLIAVGAYLADSSGTDSGKVYFYTRDGNSWRLVPDSEIKVEGNPGDQLGFDLAIDSSGKTLLVGVPFARGDSGLRCGAVREFTLDGSTILPGVTLRPLVCEAGAEFGSAVAVNSGIEAVGARGENHRRGRIYADFGDGNLQALEANVRDGDELGTSLTIEASRSSGEARIAAGAPFADAPGAADSGAIYVFTAGQAGTPVVPDVRQAGAAFGYSVSLADGILAVGEPLADAASKSDAGAVHRFSTGDWREMPPVAIGAGAGDQLGVSVSGGDAKLFAGARRAGGRGAVYPIVDGMRREAILPSPPPPVGAELGFAVATRGTLLTAGAFLENERGAAYVFEQPPQEAYVSFAEASTCVVEGEATVALIVHLETTDGKPLETPVKVDLEFCAAGTGCTAMASDFRPLKTNLRPLGKEPLTIREHTAPGEYTLARVRILADSAVEGSEILTVRLLPLPPALPKPNQPVVLQIMIHDYRLVVLPAYPLRTREHGPPVRIRVGLACAPTDTVDVTLVTTDATEGTVSPRVLTFDPDHWDDAVDLKPVDDPLCDGPQAFAVQVRTSSRDPRNNHLFQSLPAANEDDEVGCPTLFSDGFESGTLGEWDGWFPP